MEDNGSAARRSRRNILVAVDGSEHSLEAVRYVGRILPVQGTRIALFYVLNPRREDFELVSSLRSRDISQYAWQVLQRRMIQDFMDRARDLLLDLDYSSEAVSVIIKELDSEVVLDIAAEAMKGYDAIVVGRRGMSDIRDLILGSITNKLVALLRQVPVWVVGSRSGPEKILIAMDDSAGAKRAFEYVGRIFGSAHPELLLLHVTEGIDLSDDDCPGGDADPNWFEKSKKGLREAEKVMTSLFEGYIAGLERQGGDISKIKTKIVPGVYSRAAAIYGEAQEEGCGAIVVGRQNLSRVEEFLAAGVDNKILQLSQEMAVWMIP